MIAVTGPRSGQDVARLVRDALDITPLRTPTGTYAQVLAPPPSPQPVVAPADAFLANLRGAYPDWAIVADLRGGRWAAANGATEIWRDNGIELARALEAATGRRELRDQKDPPTKGTDPYVHATDH